MKNAINDAADITDDVKKHFKSTIKNMKDGSFVKFKDGKLLFLCLTKFSKNFLPKKQ